MNEFRFCPECGNKVKSDAQFCPNCGHRFNVTSNSSLASNSTSQHDQPVQNNSFHDEHLQPSRQDNKKGNGKMIAWIIAVVIIVFIGGALGYKYMMPHKTNHTKSEVSRSSKSSSSSSSSTESSSDSSSSDQANSLSSSDAQETVSDVFSAMGQSVEDDDDAPDYSQSFVNGKANSYYQSLASWANLQSNNSNINGVDISVEDFKLNGDNATFKAVYDFDNGDHHHVQVYVWNVVFKNQDNNWLILSCKSNNKAVADYDR